MLFATGFVELVSSAVSCWLASLWYGCGRATLIIGELTHINDARGCVLYRLLSIMGYSSRVQHTIILTVKIASFILHRITSTSGCSLFAYFGLGYCFWYVCISGLPYSISPMEPLQSTILSRIEKLVSHHHLLVITRVCIRGLSLLIIHDTKYLVVVTWSSASTTVVLYLTKLLTWTIPLSWIAFILIKGLVLSIGILTSIWRSHFVHEIPVKHSLSHLTIVHFANLTCWAEAISLCLVEIHFLLCGDVREHLMDSWVVCWLEHHACVVHFIDAQRSVLISSIWVSLLSHSIGHEESLVLCFVATKPKLNIKIIIKFYLHSGHLLGLRWWLTLGSSKLVGIGSLKSVCQGAVGHSMLVTSTLFEVGHHISQSCLCCWLGSLLLYLIHLLEIFFGCRIQLRIETFLCLQGSSFWFANSIYFKATAHSWVHHDFTRRLHLL